MRLMSGDVCIHLLYSLCCIRTVVLCCIRTVVLRYTRTVVLRSTRSVVLCLSFGILHLFEWEIEPELSKSLFEFMTKNDAGEDNNYHEYDKKHL